MDEIIRRWVRVGLIVIISDTPDGCRVSLIDKADGATVHGLSKDIDDAIAQAEEQYSIIANYS